MEWIVEKTFKQVIEGFQRVEAFYRFEREKVRYFRVRLTPNIMAVVLIASKPKPKPICRCVLPGYGDVCTLDRGHDGPHDWESRDE